LATNPDPSLHSVDSDVSIYMDSKLTDTQNYCESLELKNK